MPKLSLNNKFLPEKIQKSMIEAIESVREDAKQSRKEKENEMASMYSGDAKDMEKVLSLSKKGKWKEAWNHACNMDTAARDCIPDNMWRHIAYMNGVD